VHFLLHLTALQPTQAALNTYKAQLAKIIQWNNAGKTLKHVVSTLY
jgi:hypothetical protein